MSTPPYALSAVEAAKRIADGTLTSEALVRSCLDRIEDHEPDVAAWTFLDADGAIAAARRLDQTSGNGLLRGLPVGIKDVVDTVAMPTGYGSLAYHFHRPAVDAVCVTQTLAAEAIVLGKTVSTEFASRRAGKTANPHDRRFSPGGSSSGSAAAVADHMVPLAIGTQTGGSVIRPASYCGVYGLKPTFNAFSLGGVRHLAESFDTLGCMARTLEDIALYRSALMGIAHEPIAADRGAPRLGFCRTPYWDETQPAMRAMMEEKVRKLAAKGAVVVDFNLAEDGDALMASIETINKFEGARLFAYDAEHHPHAISNSARGIVAAGMPIPLDAYFAARRHIDTMRMQLDAAFENFDAIVTPSASGEAPLGLSYTGSISFNVIWTAAHTPALTMPAGTGSNGLPLGLQLVGRQYADSCLLGIVGWAAHALDLKH